MPEAIMWYFIAGGVIIILMALGKLLSALGDEIGDVIPDKVHRRLEKWMNDEDKSDGIRG